jgi:hypothetical protein
MEAYGPLTRRGLSLPAESRTSFDRSEPAHSFSAKPALTFTNDGGAAAPASADKANPDLPAAATAVISRVAPRVVELLLAGRGSLLKDIVSLIGVDRAARLIAAFGGMRLYVPHAPEPDDTLSGLIGHDAAWALARVYGGDRIDVPNPTPRRIQIVELRASGVSIDAIARSVRCTRRRVFQVLAEVRRKRFREFQQPR